MFQNRRNIFSIEKMFLKIWYFLDFRSDPEFDPDPLFHEPDPNHCMIIIQFSNILFFNPLTKYYNIF